MNIILFPIADITIPPDRQRDNAEADAALINSIERHGLISPIILRDGNVLVAGERRLDAFRKLNRPTIPCRMWDDLSPIEAFEIEFMENMARKQLSWQQEAKGVADYHVLRLAAYPGWTQMGTGEALSMTQSAVSARLEVARELGDPDVAGCNTFQAAFNLLSAKADRARIAALSRGLDVAGIAALSLPPSLPANATKEERTAALLSSVNLQATVAGTVESIGTQLSTIEQGRLASAALAADREREAVSDLVITADCLEWMTTYSGLKFDVLHLDFPYGKGYKGSNTRQTGTATMNPLYADDPDIFFGLVDRMLSLQDNIVFPAAHCIFWFDMMYYQWTTAQFACAGWQLVQPYPLIWTKGHTGVASDPHRRPRHCYETALLFSRGDRKITKLLNDHEPCPLEDTKLHTSQKPVAMLRKFLELVVDEHTAMIDLTCGSGSSLVAARQLHAARVLGVEIDPSNAEVARFLIQNRTTNEETADVS